MYCSNCGANINNGQSFCAVCGTKVPSQPMNYLENNNVGQPFNNYSGEANDEELLDAYIGKNAEKIKRKGNEAVSFSAPEFLCGLGYAVYRKMYMLAILQFLGFLIALIFLPTFWVYIYGAIKWIVILQFDKWYLKNAKEKVEKIKSENRGASQQDLIKICRKKGGTSIWGIIVIIVSFILSFALGFRLMYIYDATTDVMNYNSDIVGQQYVENNKLSATSTGYFEGYFSSVPKPKVDNTWTEETITELTDYSLSADDKAYTLWEKFTNDDISKIQPKFDEYEKQLKAIGFTFYREYADHYTYIKDDIAVVIYTGYDYLGVDLSSGYQAPHM